MAEGKQRDEWSRASLLIATIVNCRPNRPPHARPAHPRQFNPFFNRKRRPMRMMTDPHELYDMLTGVK